MQCFSSLHILDAGLHTPIYLACYTMPEKNLGGIRRIWASVVVSNSRSIYRSLWNGWHDARLNARIHSCVSRVKRRRIIFQFHITWLWGPSDDRQSSHSVAVVQSSAPAKLILATVRHRHLVFGSAMFQSIILSPQLRTNLFASIGFLCSDGMCSQFASSKPQLDVCELPEME